MASFHPIMLDIPESFESERLLIRAPLWGDGQAVNEAVAESQEQLRPWMPWARELPTIEESEAGIRRSRLEYLERNDFRLLLFHKESGRLAGSSGLQRFASDRLGSPQIRDRLLGSYIV